MKFEKVLLASDFDGTLANSEGKIDNDVISAIRYFVSEGGNFTVCTGRIYQGFHHYNKAYINAPVLMGNGAMAYDYENEKIVFEAPIGDEGINVMNSVLEKFPSVTVEMYNFNQACAVNPCRQSEEHFTNMGIVYKAVDSPQAAVRPWTKAMIYAKKCSVEVQKLLETHTEINFLRTAGDYIEVLAKGTNKGSGLLRLGKMLGCVPKDIYAAGDGYNDVDMLKAARAAFVPENGMSEALAVADYVTRSNNDGCIAHTIEILDKIY